MASKFAGFVARISKKDSKPGAKRAWTLYSFKAEKEDGNEYEQWFGFGFEEPPFKEGDYITFEAEQKDGYWNYVKGSGNKPKNPPARKQARQSNSSSGSDNGGTKSPSDSPVAAGADRQTQIVMQHSQEMALALVGLLLTHDALPVSSAKTKSGEAKRYEEIVAFVNKETVRLYNDVVTARLLETVVDSGVIDVKPDAALPEIQEDDSPIESDERNEDSPF